MSVSSFEFPKLSVNALISPTAKVAMSNEVDLTLDVDIHGLLVDLIEDPNLKLIILPDIDIDTEMM